MTTQASEISQIEMVYCIIIFYQIRNEEPTLYRVQYFGFSSTVNTVQFVKWKMDLYEVEKKIILVNETHTTDLQLKCKNLTPLQHKGGNVSRRV